MLIADDFHDIVELLLEHLRLDAPHLKVFAATRGDEALMLGLAVEAEVYLLDMVLPGMTGLEVALRVRQQHGAKPLLIAMTGGAIAPVVERAGVFDHVLRKPIDVKELIGLIDAASGQ